MTLDRFYPIFESAEWLARMLPLGLRLVQLRVKNQPRDAIRREVCRSRRLCDTHGATLVINDHWQTAIDTGCRFVHLGQEDLDAADTSAIRSSGIRIGVSTHSREELDRAMSLDPDYVALGPIYRTVLKEMKWSEQGLARLSEWKRLVGARPLVAIGGMTVERAAGAFRAGADVVSVVTDITLNSNPEERVRQWVETTR